MQILIIQTGLVVSDSELDEIISDIKTAHPNAGEINIMGHLRARKLCAKEQGEGIYTPCRSTGPIITKLQNFLCQSLRDILS